MESLSRAREQAGGREYVGEATFNGCVAVCDRPRREIERWLPRGIRLTEPSTQERADHPIVFLFGEQTRGTIHFGGVPFPLGIRYDEFALLVPNVELGASSRLHTLVARMYSSYFPAVWSGNAHYGFAKELARMRWRGTEFSLTSPGGRVAVRAVVERRAEWGRAATSPSRARSTLELLTRLSALGMRRDGSVMRSRFHFGLDRAQVREVDAEITVDSSIVAGQPLAIHRATEGRPRGPRHVVETRLAGAGMTARLHMARVAAPFLALALAQAPSLADADEAAAIRAALISIEYYALASPPADYPVDLLPSPLEQAAAFLKKDAERDRPRNFAESRRRRAIARLVSAGIDMTTDPPRLARHDAIAILLRADEEKLNEILLKLRPGLESHVVLPQLENQLQGFWAESGAAIAGCNATMPELKATDPNDIPLSCASRPTDWKTGMLWKRRACK
jgi:hypothetical protein